MLDPIRKAAAAIHAGRQSTALRISSKVVRKLVGAFGSSPSDLIVVLGPSIRACCYEVDESAVKPFRKTLPWVDSCVFTLESLNSGDRSSEIEPSNLLRLPGEMVSTPTRVKPTRPASKSLRLDLVLANYFELLDQGVQKENIFVVDYCTACHPDLFFSHRRDRGRTGRHIALAGFKRSVIPTRDQRMNVI